MPNAVAHILLPVFLIDIVRDYLLKKPFPRKYVLIGGIAGLFPDIDIPLEYLMEWITGRNWQLHGGITHSLVWPLLSLLLAVILWKHQDYRILFLVIATGLAIHTGLDCFLQGPFYSPLQPFSSANGFCVRTWIAEHAAALDAVIFVLWLVHEEYKKKIRDYI